MLSCGTNKCSWTIRRLTSTSWTTIRTPRPIATSSPPGYDIDSRLEQFKSVFKNRKDRFRRYRDLSAFCFIGVYLLSVVDAYVDAQLSVFDISPDLSLRVAPALIETNNGPSTLPAMGLGATFTF